MQIKRQRLELDMEQTSSKLGKEYIKAVYCHESVPRQVDKKSGGSQGDRGLGFSRRGKGSGILKEDERTNFFSLYIP